MIQEKVIRKRIHNLEQIYFAETMKDHRNQDKWFLGIIEQRMKQEKTKLTLLKIGQYGN
jgi:uncharacterized membrane protein